MTRLRPFQRLLLLAIVALSLLLLLVPLRLFFAHSPQDSETFTVLSGATRVEVFRLDGFSRDDEDRARAPGKRMGGFLVTGRGQDQGPEFAARLAAVLSDPGTYHGDRAACFWPGVAFRLWRDDRAVDGVICFKCENFYCGPPTAGARENGSFHRTPARARLIELAREAFPDDPEIQGLNP